ncbi:glycosyl hydrolase family 17 protein [Dyella sp.]|jgi:glucan 1,3-beta-glucosidase|uniref:glycoside hydrolase family 17 protein n=1 Tax=Dyella sp. TaxID=1869338 RepID=UPI002D77CBE3|nr:glycosyl hydrolase family 17 protein [Dyella sp.]HET6431923.1 glycosyl hydrolase family 17 protein [Dyella sp.]
MTPAALPSSRPHWPIWLGLILAAFGGLGWWWLAGRPVALPDAPSSRIACVSYAPYRLAGQTPYDPATFIPPGQIDADLRALSRRFDCVRTYSQGQGLDAVPAIAGRYGMKVLMGVWIGRDAAANAREIALATATARAHPQVLRGVIVGNEVLLRGEQSPAALAGYLRQARAALPPAVPITYADVWEFWLRHPELAGSVDYITVHVLPYWEDDPVPPARAVQHVADVYARVRAAFPGKPVMIGETGWPSAGRPRQGATASLVNEARYLREFLRYAATARIPYNVIEAFDQGWKRAQEGTVGGYWGIFDADAQPKFPMEGPVTEIPRWWLGWLAAALGALVFVLAARVHGRRARAALGLAGIASGTALAWQVRQMLYACGPWWEWVLSGAACLAALLTALSLSRVLAAALQGRTVAPPSRRLRFGWLLVLAYEGLLLVFDGRYRDFPLGLFALPAVGYALVAMLGRAWPGERRREETFLAVVVPLLAAIVLAQELAISPVAWLWLGLNMLAGFAVLWPAAHQQHRAEQ